MKLFIDVTMLCIMIAGQDCSLHYTGAREDV